MLRDAREAQSIPVEDVAQRLRLMQRQVKAMEEDDFGSLGQPVFARGFVRNYARLLGLAPESLLSRMDGAPDEPASVAPVEPLQPHSWLSSPWLILSLLGLLLLVAVPVALYVWLNSGGEESPNTNTQALAVMPSHPSLAATTVPAAAPAEPTASAAIPVVLPPTASATDSVPPDANTPAATATAPAPAAEVEDSVLHLEFADASWTEIKDAGGHMLLRQLNPAGSNVDVRGQPPFDVVIGNASQVQVTYNGRPIDLKPFIDVTVARFTLEE